MTNARVQETDAVVIVREPTRDFDAKRPGASLSLRQLMLCRQFVDKRTWNKIRFTFRADIFWEMNRKRKESRLISDFFIFALRMFSFPKSTRKVIACVGENHGCNRVHQLRKSRANLWGRAGLMSDFVAPVCKALRARSSIKLFCLWVRRDV